MPTLYIQNGIVSVNQKMPYFVANKQGEVVVIADTRDETTSMDILRKKYPQLSLFIRKQSIDYLFQFDDLYKHRMNSSKKESVSSINLPGNLTEIFSGKEMVESASIEMVRLCLPIIVCIVVVALCYGFFLPIIFCLSFLGRMLAVSIFSFRMKTKPAYRLFCVTMTPQVFLMFIALAFDWLTAPLGFFMIALWVIYFCYAVIVIRRASRQVVIS